MPAYLKNADLLAEVKKAREVGYMTDELTRMFMLMVSKYITHPWWNNYSYKSDMMGQALLNLTNAALKFDPEKSTNAFSYYTEIIKNSFLQVKKYEKKHRDIRDVMLVEYGMEPSHTWLEEQTKKQAELKLKLKEDARLKAELVQNPADFFTF